MSQKTTSFEPSVRSAKKGVFFTGWGPQPLFSGGGGGRKCVYPERGPHPSLGVGTTTFGGRGEEEDFRPFLAGEKEKSFVLNRRESPRRTE